MTQSRWDVPGYDDDDQTSAGHPSPTLVSLHFIRSTLRRRWLICVLSPVIGLLAVVTFLVVSPAPHDAKASLVLAHDPHVDPVPAMATDVSLLMTRAVASETIASLGLTMTPDDFLKSVTAVPVSSELLTITLGAPTDAEAVRRLNALTTIYLKFRGEQLSLQSNVLVDGIQQRISKLKAEVTTLSRQIEELTAAGGSAESKLSDTIAQRAYVQGRIETLQQSVEDAMLQTTAVVSSSRVIDRPAAETGGVKKRIALAFASGIIGGAAFGCGLVLFFAIISDRLRRRSDIAAALEVPVPVSVGRIEPLSKRWLWFPPWRKLDGRRAHDRQLLAHAIEMELPLPRRWGRLAVACIDNADEVRFAVATAARDLAASGCSVALIDLTEHGNLDIEAAPSIHSSAETPTVLRPRGIPALADGPADLHVVGHEHGIPPSLDQDVTLVLADLDPMVGVDHLRAWTDRVIVVVTAGRSSAEGVRTAAEFVRTAGLEMRFAALLHTDHVDDSSGTAGFDRATPVHLAYAADQEEVAGEVEAIAEEQATTEQELATVEETIAESQTPSIQEEAAEEQTAAEYQVEEQPADEAQATDQEEAIAEEQDAEEHLAYPEQATTEEQPAYLEQATTEEQPAYLEQATTEEQPAYLEQATTEEQPEDDERAAVVLDEPSAEEQIPEQPVDDEQVTDQEEATTEERDAEEQPAALEQATTEEQPEDDEQAAAVLDEAIAEEQLHEQPAEEEQAADILDEDEQVQEQPAEEGEAAVLDEPNAEEQLHEQPAEEEQAAAVLSQAAAEGQLQELPPGVQHAPDEQEAPAAVAGAVGSLAWRRHLRRRHRRRGQQAANLHADPIRSVDPAETLPIDRIAADEQAAEEQPAVEERASDWEEIAAGEPADETDLVGGPDQVANHSWDETAVDGWDLYIDTYPPAYRSVPRSENDELDEFNWDWDLDDADSKQDFAVIGADDEVQVASDDSWLTTSEEGGEEGPVQQVRSKADTRDGAELAGNGWGSNGSNGQGHHADEAHTGLKL